MSRFKLLKSGQFVDGLPKYQYEIKIINTLHFKIYIIFKVVFTQRYKWQNFGSQDAIIMNQNFAMCNTG